MVVLGGQVYLCCVVPRCLSHYLSFLSDTFILTPLSHTHTLTNIHGPSQALSPKYLSLTHTLTHPHIQSLPQENGALRSSDIGSDIAWVEEARAAALSDVLRVHEWPYVKNIQSEKLKHICDQWIFLVIVI